MIVCTNCGFENETDASFCGGCQEFLEWTGKAAEPEPEPEPDFDEADEERKGLVERVVDRLRPEDDVDHAAPVTGDAAVAPSAAAGPSITATADPSAAIAAEAAERAEREAEQAEAQQREAEERARAEAAATERARQHAAEAEKARKEAEEAARAEAAAAERIRAELEAAQAARQQAEAELQQEAEAAKEAREAAAAKRADTEADVARAEAEEAAETERLRAQTEARLEAERAAMAEVEAELERAEAARRAAEARAQAETKAAEAASAAAAEAESVRLAAEARAQEEARTAEKARRAAALVARPAPTPPSEPPRAAPTRPATPRKPDRSRRRKPTPEAPAAAAGTPNDTTASSPAAVKPDRTRVRAAARAQQKSTPTRKLRPGDLVCGQCGEGNTPTRNFCRRCGHTLAEAEVVRRAWWKRVIPRRKPQVHAAGARPSRGLAGDVTSVSGAAGGKGGKGAVKGAKGAVRGLQGLRRKVMGPIGKITRPLMFVTMAAAAVGLTFSPNLRTSVGGPIMRPVSGVFDRVMDMVSPQFTPVTPIDAEASSQRGDTADGFCCDPDNVLKFGNTWWHASGGGVDQFLVITLDAPTDIAKFGIIPGTGDDTWAEFPRPREVEVDFIGQDGATVTSAPITGIRDEHESNAQIFDVAGADDVVKVRVTVKRVYGQGLDSADVAISEIRLFALEKRAD